MHENHHHQLKAIPLNKYYIYIYIYILPGESFVARGNQDATTPALSIPGTPPSLTAGTGSSGMQPCATRACQLHLYLPPCT